MSATAAGIIGIAVIMVIITDLSGVVPYIKRWLYRKLTGKAEYPDTWDTPIIHLLSCSLCQTWWVGLFYLILTHSLTIWWVAFLLIISFLTTTIRDLLMLIKAVLDKIINKIWENVQ